MSENENVSKIIDINISDEMQRSYLDYAMTVIVSRALPDVRDGLKPVHRRILYSASELGLSPDKPHKKSARIVGDVLGKYHPHGDTAVYDAMVRLAQSFSMRYQLIDGHGNFGSVDGDQAAAMRYTEARMSKMAMEMLRDFNKDTVDFRPNFDETLKEPVVLPSRFPNLLVNGSSGIAVGMASSIPPHNLGEVINGTIAYIENPDIDIPGLMRYIKGPDFPTGAIIEGKDNIKNAYLTGRGILRVKAKVEIEEMKNNKSRILVSELPYQVNKARLIEKTAELVKDKRIEGISDIRDESDRTGMRIVIEIKRDYNPNIVLNQLYKHTQMQDSFSVIMIALVNNEPKVLNLKEMIYHYVEHQREVIVRRTKYDLNKAEARAHIIEGLLIAIDNIDEVIRIIRASYDDAEKRLIEAFNLSEIQARAIVDMRLRRLQGLEREKLNIEYDELIKLINKFKEILSNKNLIDQIVKDELKEIKNNFYDERRTDIIADEGEINVEDLIEEEDVAITLTHFGYIKRLPEDTYKAQNRGGKGITALTTRDEDFVKDLFITSTHDYLMFVTNKGKIYKIKAYEVPEARRQAKGTAAINLINIEAGEKIKSVIPIREFNDDEFLIFVTKKGIIKKTKLSEFESNRKTGLVAIKIAEDDELISVNKTDGTKDIFILTKRGKGIRFHESDVRDTGRNTMGVKAITLTKNDELIAMSIIKKSDETKHILTVTENGYAKITLSQEYRPQNRGGKGMKAHNINKKTGLIVNSLIVDKEDDIMILSTNGTIIRMHATNISIMGRDTQGVIAMRLKGDDKVASIAKIFTEEDIEKEE
ncbi:MAG: DNA gyrase subunit A [Tissierellia bacterium]|jgi:DNA gyrase subunit A|nr:DNA gyrase subunit A [Tissierellia bacterium]MDD3225991.1 DNA gyrase subunit A [Tissierellia bacterium]MDD3751162.1 DNA gyrase subunit A [Tissierellia bacterium]MDD4046416.1 DNA gyrase subunit A [Tissierellia bacterium]MDD4677851.1 DNA gyrase subunit A [Tissierellia bacterium]